MECSQSARGVLPAPPGAPTWFPGMQCEFEFEAPPQPAAAKRRGARTRGLFAATSTKITEIAPAAPPPASTTKADLKPASDVLAGAVARAASQGTIHPLDTLKVRMQHSAGGTATLSKFSRLVPPAGANMSAALQRAVPRVASLYKGVLGAASGAGIYIGTYFAVYGAATNVLTQRTALRPGPRAFVAGAIAAAGGSVVKVPLAVCIRSVQAGVYPNAWSAATSIAGVAGVRGLFTGYLPTLLEDVPDMAFKFAAYETLRSVHRQLHIGQKPTPQEDFAMGAIAGAFAAAATTPLDVIKTHMMCTAASRPSMRCAAAAVFQQGGAAPFFRGVGPRALSNGINSAVFFCFFEALRATFARQQAARRAAAAAAIARPMHVDTRSHARTYIQALDAAKPAVAA